MIVAPMGYHMHQFLFRRHIAWALRCDIAYAEFSSEGILLGLCSGPKAYHIRRSLLRSHISSDNRCSDVLSHPPILSPEPYHMSRARSQTISPRLSSRASFLYSSNSPTKRTLLVLLITFTSTSTYDYSLCLFNADMPYL